MEAANINNNSSVNIFDIKFYHIFIFPISWLIFLIIGKLFFENGLGQYHSTSSKKWATICRSLFLLTFVTCCTLLELVCFEILDLLHPALRLLFWTTSLSLLALLLNVLIPAVLATSVGFHGNYSIKMSLLLGAIAVILFQVVMLITSSLLDYYHNRFYSNKNNYNIDIMLESSPTVLAWFFMLDSENSNNKLNHAYITPVLKLLEFILRFDVQKSIASIAVLGTIFAAIISGKR